MEYCTAVFIALPPSNLTLAMTKIEKAQADTGEVWRRRAFSRDRASVNAQPLIADLYICLMRYKVVLTHPDIQPSES